MGDVVDKEDSPNDEGEKKDNKDDSKGYDNIEKVDKDNEVEDSRLIKRRTS
jgi:hypothetical protein